MYRDLFQRVTAASQNNSLTFFVGAGISKLSNAPKWSELIDAFCANLGIDKRGTYSNEEFLSIPQMYYYSINQDDTEYYIEILNMSDLEKNNLPADVLSKYHKISKIFQKARIYYVFGDGHKALEIEGEPSVFADPLCINFEYRSMIEYTKAEYTSNYDNYKKAYYLLSR